MTAAGPENSRGLNIQAVGGSNTFENNVLYGGGLSSDAVVLNETPSGVIDGVNVDFTVAFDFISTKIAIYLNGIRQQLGVGNDFEETGTNQISFAYAPVSGDTIIADYIKS